MTIDRDALIRIKIGLTGGEAGTAIDRIVGRLEAVDKRLAALGNGGGGSATPTAQAMHISPIPLPVRVSNFEDLRNPRPSDPDYNKVRGQPRYEQQTPPGHADQFNVPMASSASPPKPKSGAGGFMSAMRSVFASLHFADGGVVQQRYGTGGDDEPALLTPGERVMTVGVAQRHRDELDAMERGVPHMAEGGMVKRLHGWMRDRYGAKGLANSMAFGQAATWAASAGLTAAMGFPMMLPPGSGLLAGLASAEIRHQFKSPATLAREKAEHAVEEEKRAKALANLSSLPAFPAEASHFGAGGYVPAYLTPGERVLSAGVAAANRARLDEMMTGAKHYASGTPFSSYQGPMNQPGAPIGPMLPVATQNVYVVNYRDFQLGTGGGGKGKEAKSGWANDWASGLQHVSKIASAAGAGEAAGLASSGANLASAITAGGPAGIAVAGGVLAIGLFDLHLTKSTKTLEIWNDSFATNAQKMRATSEEFVPFSGKLFALVDAIEGVNDRVKRAGVNMERDLNRIGAEFTANRAKASLEQERNRYQSQAVGMASQNIAAAAPVGSYNLMTGHGRLQAQEEDIKLAAQDALTNAQRRTAAAEEEDRRQQARLPQFESDAANSQLMANIRGRASREAIRGEQTGRSASPLRSVLNAGLNVAGPLPGLIGQGLMTNIGERAETAARELQSQERLQKDLNALSQEQTKAQQTALEAQRARNEQAKVAVGLAQAELQILQQRSQRMESDAMRLGGMDRGQRRQAVRALQILRQRGPEAVDRNPALARQAAMVDPMFVQDAQRQTGEREMRRVAGMGVLSERPAQDWQGGQARLGDTLDRERTLSQSIRQQLDAVSVQSAQNLANTFTDTFTKMADIIDRQLKAALAAFDARLTAQGRQIINGRN